MHAFVDCHSLVMYNTQSHTFHMCQTLIVYAAPAVYPGRTRFSSLVCQYGINTCMCARMRMPDLLHNIAFALAGQLEFFRRTFC